jgi:hypothetical protein
VPITITRSHDGRSWFASKNLSGIGSPKKVIAGRRSDPHAKQCGGLDCRTCDQNAVVIAAWVETRNGHLVHCAWRQLPWHSTISSSERPTSYSNMSIFCV